MRICTSSITGTRRSKILSQNTSPQDFSNFKPMEHYQNILDSIQKKDNLLAILLDPDKFPFSTIGYRSNCAFILYWPCPASTSHRFFATRIRRTPTAKNVALRCPLLECDVFHPPLSHKFCQFFPPRKNIRQFGVV